MGLILIIGEYELWVNMNYWCKFIDMSEYELWVNMNNGGIINMGEYELWVNLLVVPASSGGGHTHRHARIQTDTYTDTFIT